ncbi:MAG: hypothetical protein WBW94_13180 [Anaerolineales bacterium]
MIKPYYLQYTGNEYGWQMPMEANPPNPDTVDYMNVQQVEKFAVENSVIMLYTRYKEPNRANFGEKDLYWFVIAPTKNIEEGFDKEADFLNYLQLYRIQQPSWINPDEAMAQFGNTGCLTWIPYCK